MDSQSLKNKTLSGLIWKFSERITAQLVTFVVSIVLARLLEPSHYGAIAIVNIFITLANVFVDSGFGNSLVQKKDADNIDFSSVFYFNIFMSLVMYGILFAAAPFVAKFFHMEILSPVLRVLSIRLVVAGINSVQHAYVSKKMLFKRFFWSTLFGTVLSAVVGITMAYHGFGVWALVGQYMTNTTVDTIVLWFTVSWRPGFTFSFQRMKGLFSYGWKLLVSSLLDKVYGQLRGMILGRMYSAEDLAFYSRGHSFPDLVVANINTSIGSVLFPAMASEQDKREQVKSMMRRSIRTSGYLMFPLMFGLALVAKPFVLLLLTKKWIECVPYLRIFCFTYALMPVQTANLQAIKAMGRSDLFLKLEIIKKIMGLLVLMVSMHFGVFIMALSTIFTTIFSSIVNAFPNKNLLDYKYLEQIKDLLNGIIPLLLMAASVIGVGMINMGDLYKLILQVLTGGVVYIAISVLTKNDSFYYILDTAKSLLNRRNEK